MTLTDSGLFKERRISAIFCGEIHYYDQPVTVAAWVTDLISASDGVFMR